jgi:hypothetical protein
MPERVKVIRHGCHVGTQALAAQFRDWFSLTSSHRPATRFSASREGFCPRQPANSGKVVAAEAGCGLKGNEASLPRHVGTSLAMAHAVGEEQCLLKPVMWSCASALRSILRANRTRQAYCD